MSDKKEKIEKAVQTAKIKRKERLNTVKNNIKNSQLKLKTAGSHTVTQNKLKIIITIVGRKKAEYYADLIQSFDVNMQLICMARGTASANMVELLGLTDSDKAVIISVIQENKLQDALNALDEKFKTIKDGKGVACTVALSSVIGTLIYGFLSDNKLAVKENK